VTAREDRAVAEHACPRQNCAAPPGDPCRRVRGLYHSWVSQTFKHPHPERVALVRGNVAAPQ
jgi:hypothetical protein